MVARIIFALSTSFKAKCCSQKTVREFFDTIGRKADRESNWHICQRKELAAIYHSASTYRQYRQSNRIVKIEAHFQEVIESGAKCDNNLPTMGLFDLFKLLRKETILGVEIGLVVSIIFHLYS